MMIQNVQVIPQIPTSAAAADFKDVSGTIDDTRPCLHKVSVCEFTVGLLYHRTKLYRQDYLVSAYNRGLKLKLPGGQ